MFPLVPASPGPHGRWRRRRARRLSVTPADSSSPIRTASLAWTFALKAWGMGPKTEFTRRLGGYREIGDARAHNDLLDDRARHHRIDHRRRRYAHVFAPDKRTISSRRTRFFHIGRDPGSLHLLQAEDSFSPGLEGLQHQPGYVADRRADRVRGTCSPTLV